MNKIRARWIAAAAVPIAAVGAAVGIPLAAGASPALPTKSADDVLELIAESDGVSFSGTLEQTSALGLPELPEMGGDSGDGVQSALELLTGSHEARIFVAGEDRSRVQVLDRLAERDVIRNGDDVWLYDSAADEATHATLPDHEDAPSGTTLTPGELADRLLAGVEDSTEVSVEEHARVAGRDAYVLSFTPRTDDTLIASVSLSVDAETGLPLGAEVRAAGQDEAAFSVVFRDVDFSAPADSLFEFTPPASATVTEAELPAHDPSKDRSDADDHVGPEPTVTGEGWSTIVTLPAAGMLPEPGTDTGSAEAGAEVAGMLDQLTTPVAGGRVLQTSLVSVLLTDDGRVLAGAVPADSLIAAAGQ